MAAFVSSVCLLKCLQQVLRYFPQVGEALFQNRRGRRSLSLNADVNLGLGGMGHRVSAKVDIRILHDYMAKRISQCMILVLDGKGHVSRASVVVVGYYL